MAKLKFDPVEPYRLEAHWEGGGVTRSDHKTFEMANTVKSLLDSKPNKQGKLPEAVVIKLNRRS